MRSLTEPERRQLLPALKNWSLVPDRDAIQRSFVFRDFAEAFGFMSEIAPIAEKSDHHPEWLNVWSRVDILLTTHDAGGLSTKDVSLARKIDEVAARRGSLLGPI